MWDFKIENIGGICTGTTQLHPGVNAVQADNWQGKSSFLMAIQTVMGTTGLDSETHPLTEGRDGGYVQLETDDDTYRVELSRESTAIDRTGNTFLDDYQDRVCAQLFAFLGEQNQIRAAVRNNGNLAELLRRPLDIENIDEKITEKQREQRQVQKRLESAEDAADRLPKVQKEITQLENEIEELRDQREQIEEKSSNVNGVDENLRDRLSDERALRDRLGGQIDTLENKIEREESRLEEKKSKLDSLEAPSEPEYQADINEKQERANELRRQINLLEDLHSANKQALKDDYLSVVTDVERGVQEDQIECWVSGDTTTRSEINAKLDGLRQRFKDLRQERQELQEEINDIEQRRNRIRSVEKKQERLQSEISDLEMRIEANQEELKNRKEQLDEVVDTVARLEGEVEETDDEITDIESQIKLKERQLDDKRTKLSELESKAEKQDDHEEEYDEIVTKIEELRNRKKNKQLELVDQFDRAIDEIIARFAPGFESARLDPKTDPSGEITDFELIVARDGREANLDALSQGEVELVGIVAALAGYKTFDVSDRVPVILLDGIGALTKSHTHDLVDYLMDETEYLVTTAYPESGDFSGHKVTPDKWQVVSDEQPATA